MLLTSDKNAKYHCAYSSKRKNCLKRSTANMSYRLYSHIERSQKIIHVHYIPAILIYQYHVAKCFLKLIVVTMSDNNESIFSSAPQC